MGLGEGDGCVGVGELHLEVVALRVVGIGGGGAPLHQGRLIGGLGVEVNNPVVANGLVLWMVVNVLFLRHVDVGGLVLETLEILPRLHEQMGGSRRLNTLVAPHRDANLVGVGLVGHLVFRLLNGKSLNSSIHKLVSIGMSSSWDSHGRSLDSILE